MKKLLFSLLTLGSLSLLTTTAQAEQYKRYVRYYDHCGRPVYGYIALDRCQTYGSSGYSHQRSSDYRPRYSYETTYRSSNYYQPSYRSYDSHQSSHCRSRSSGSLLSLIFGF